MADAGKRQMRAREQQPVGCHHVENLSAVRQRQCRVGVECDRACRFIKLQSRAMDDIAPDQESSLPEDTRTIEWPTV